MIAAVSLRLLYLLFLQVLRLVLLLGPPAGGARFFVEVTAHDHR